MRTHYNSQHQRKYICLINKYNKEKRAVLRRHLAGAGGSRAGQAQCPFRLLAARWSRVLLCSLGRATTPRWPVWRLLCPAYCCYFFPSFFFSLSLSFSPFLSYLFYPLPFSPPTSTKSPTRSPFFSFLFLYFLFDPYVYYCIIFFLVCNVVGKKCIF